jgi:hypothetical protein
MRCNCLAGLKLKREDKLGGFGAKCRFRFSKALLSTTQPPHQLLREYGEQSSVANSMREISDAINFATISAAIEADEKSCSRLDFLVTPS